MNCRRFFQIRSDRTAGHDRPVPLYGKTGYGAELWPARMTAYDFAGTIAGIGVRYLCHGLCPRGSPLPLAEVDVFDNDGYFQMGGESGFPIPCRQR
jgi:hypothetical protein